MKIEPGQTISLDGQTLVARETFRASGTTWVRYSVAGKRSDESRYTTRDEWLAWFFRQRQPAMI